MMHMGMMTTLLLFVLSSGYFYSGSIIPALVGRLILFKTKLILGHAIGVGAFVIGQGSGLLIGKLIGISYIVNKYIKLKRVSNHRKVTHFQFGLNRPFYYHKHPIPPRHHDWSQFPNIQFSQYNQRPYGTYTHNTYNQRPYGTYAQDTYNQSPYETYAHDTSGYTYSTPYQYSPGATGSGYYAGTYPYNSFGGTSHAYDSAPTDVYDPTVYTSNTKSPVNTDNYESTESDDTGGYEASYTGTGGEDGGHGSFQETNSKYESDSSEEDPRWHSPNVGIKLRSKEKSAPDSVISPAEQYIIDHFLKSTNEQPGMSEGKKLDILADLLRGQFHEEFLSAVDSGDSKGHSEVTNTKSSLPAAPLKKVKRQKESGKTKKKVSKGPKNEKTIKPPVTLMSPLVDVFTKMDSADLIPESFMSWFLDGHGGVDSISDEPEFKLHMSSRKKRAAPVEQTDDLDLKTDEVTVSFIQDIKNLFSIVSFLDINRCLEKMVCDIHSRGSSASGTTEYEKNIVTAFRIMDKIMPLDFAEIDSTTKYRQAAHVGQKSMTDGKTEACQQMFAVCGFSSQQIIHLGDIAVPTPQNGESVDGSGSSSSGASPPLSIRNAEDMDANSGV